MARNITISTARTIVYKEHGTECGGKETRSPPLSSILRVDQGEAALRACAWVYSGVNE